MNRIKWTYIARVLSYISNNNDMDELVQAVDPTYKMVDLNLHKVLSAQQIC